jgi:hypothetical protein
MVNKTFKNYGHLKFFFLTKPCRRFGLLTLCLAAWFNLIMAGTAMAISERVVSDQTSGIALFGYDPVAYWTEGAAVKGSDQFEWEWQGLTWQFRHEGNLKAFQDRPDLYAPAFGGYCLVGLSEGYFSPGYPQIWMIDNNTLLLFYSHAQKEIYLSNKNLYIRRANEAWARMKPQLVGR